LQLYTDKLKLPALFFDFEILKMSTIFKCLFFAQFLGSWYWKVPKDTVGDLFQIQGGQNSGFQAALDQSDSLKLKFL
jgi:hypothetical protein